MRYECERLLNATSEMIAVFKPRQVNFNALGAHFNAVVSVKLSHLNSREVRLAAEAFGKAR